MPDKHVLKMGILNITPDSFSDGGRYLNIRDAIIHAKKLIKAGFNIIDVGGESTRPGASRIKGNEEIKRILPVIKELVKLKKRSKFLISVDTYKSKVAGLALGAGADIINDPSGLSMDKSMVKVLKKYNCKIVIMHNSGIPAKKYTGKRSKLTLIKEINSWLKKQINYALKHGIKKENVILDPGIGFGKSTQENLYIIKNIKKIKTHNYPILIGLSKKSFIKELFPRCSVNKKTVELNKLAVNNGADIIRMHLL